MITRLGGPAFQVAMMALQSLAVSSAWFLDDWLTSERKRWAEALKVEAVHADDAPAFVAERFGTLIAGAIMLRSSDGVRLRPGSTSFASRAHFLLI